MSSRDSRQAAEERAIFQASLKAYPSFAKRVVNFEQPHQLFPDIVAKLHDGSEVNFELAEWLDNQQMEQSKQIERVELAILDALGSQGINGSDHIRCVMLVLRENVPRFRQQDGLDFRNELYRLISDTDRRWPMERHWQSPQGRICRQFSSFPILNKYLRSVHFDPLRFGNTIKERWRTGHPWIFFQSRGGSYSSDTALIALLEIIRKKEDHYGKQEARGVSLMVYYSQAVLYNTPFYGIKVNGFNDAAKFAADRLMKMPIIFEKVYLFQALEPDLQAFEVYPTLLKCQ
jgi:hypothetical protein